VIQKTNKHQFKGIMKNSQRFFKSTISFAVAALVASSAAAGEPKFDCKGLPTHAELTTALKAVVAGADSAGFGLNMWATIVNRDGEVCLVAFSGTDRGEQWPGSRVISAQKANTANAFSLPSLPLSTANLYSATQPGGSLFGLPHSNPVDTAAAYQGPSENYGKPNDPLTGKKCGGVNVFGGGLALYGPGGTLLGAIGVSGDTSCTDHIVAWKIRHALNLDNLPGGVSATGDDNIVHDIVINATGHAESPSGWGHPDCGAAEVAIAAALPGTHPVGPTP
jgi:uncharacterized protein GlcG (DUF336 family)